MKIKILSTFVILVFLFSSCSEINMSESLARKEVSFTSGPSVSVSKAKDVGDSWKGNERIGVYMLENKSLTIAEGASNLEYSTSSTGKTAVFTTANPIYYPVSESKAVDFLSYHPYTSRVNNFVYPVNVKVQTNQAAIDLMSAKEDNNGVGYTKNHVGPINLQFRHELAKIIINVVAGTGVENLNGLSLTIKGMNTLANFSISDRDLSGMSEVADIIPVGSAAQFEAILLPTALTEAHLVEFKLGGDTYVWVIKNSDIEPKTFAKGSMYLYNVSLNRTGVSITGTIKEWDVYEGVGVAN